MPEGNLKKNWSMSADAFRRLLDWLDEGADSGGENYLEMQRRLFIFFDRKNCSSPLELADETLNRVARRLEEAGTIDSETPAQFCYITARFVFLEHLRQVVKKNVPLDETARQTAASLSAKSDAEENELQEKRLDCLERCTAKLDAASRDLIIKYYYGAERVKIENRRALAQKLGISSNALSIRACRIRDKLESCVRNCVAEN